MVFTYTINKLNSFIYLTQNYWFRPLLFYLLVVFFFSFTSFGNFKFIFAFERKFGRFLRPVHVLQYRRLASECISFRDFVEHKTSFIAQLQIHTSDLDCWYVFYTFVVLLKFLHRSQISSMPAQVYTWMAHIRHPRVENNSKNCQILI